ncbi:hypothetical protein OH77DRAFT_1524875 [Trametes cingulata]|nr:hypothetical protein OH77DRAFT_1524875 [Trametes cingulata]
MSKVKPAWDIYAEALLPLRHGHPLWMPEPPSDGFVVDVGDVGWVSKGAFRQLLRTRHPNMEEQPYRALRKSANQFPPLGLKPEADPKANITSKVVLSSTCEEIMGQPNNATADSSAPAAPGPEILDVKVKFKCKSDSGALLLLDPKGEKTSLPAQTLPDAEEYVRRHAPKWEKVATEELGLDVQLEDLFFVTGVVRTSRWAVAAFSGAQPETIGTVSCKLGSTDPRAMEMRFAEATLSSSWYRVGPVNAQEQARSVGERADAAVPAPALVSPSMLRAAAPVPDKQDQCTFFKYLRAKRRLLAPLKLEAGAGPHQLPRDPDRTDGGAKVLADDDVSVDTRALDDRSSRIPSDIRSVYDPVRDVLDYILLHSDAEMAIASDSDLYALFEDEEFPKDVAAALEQRRPPVRVDPNGVGKIVLPSVQPAGERGAAGDQREQHLRLTLSGDWLPRCAWSAAGSYGTLDRHSAEGGRVRVGADLWNGPRVRVVQPV